jgi:hypothetical protein
MLPIGRPKRPGEPNTYNSAWNWLPLHLPDVVDLDVDSSRAHPLADRLGNRGAVAKL